MTTIYRGARADGLAEAWKEVDGRRVTLRRRLDLANHSPTGFEWGYAGSGPAQLALAILADAIGDDARALELHQRFKVDKIAMLPRPGPWLIFANEVRLWAERQIVHRGPTEDRSGSDAGLRLVQSTER